MDAHAVIQPNPLMMLPFAALLGTIALGPLFFANWWGKHYPKVAYALGAITLLYYFFGLHAGTRVLHVAQEYVSFIALIGSLYVVSGGIHISVKGEATPFANVVFLLVGAVIANLLGTTGASMLLIRPWIRMNKYRITAHHIVFFIFIVSNVGGCLTPIGDPPLFLGYLKGVPFWWVTEHCWPMWLTGIGVLLAMFFVADTLNYRKAPKPVREKLAEPPDAWKFEGTSNLVFLTVILCAVFINHPLFLREALMIGAAAGSYYTTKKHVHAANDFNFHPVQEVAILFIGIFATMMPALDWLAANTNAEEVGKLGLALNPAFFYFGSGILSSVLDNAPTYLAFLSAVFGAFIDPHTIEQIQAFIQNGGDLATLTGPHADHIRNTIAALQQYKPELLAAKTVSVEQIEIAYLLGNAELNKYIVSISIGAVFFGANTYIGNGPNFMVKAIADQQKVHTPSFLGYVFKYSLPIMFPMLLIVWFFFFRK
ncbi:MAG TPA: sodium:proton antiporter [Verrucomicrobiae bacterium]